MSTPYHTLCLSPPIHKRHILPPTILENLTQTFQLTHSYFFGPLTCPTNFSQYLSLYERDKKIGSLGPTFSNQWARNGYAHITNIVLFLKVIKWARLANYTNLTATTLITITHDDWSNNKINPLTGKDVTPISSTHPSHHGYIHFHRHS